VLNDRTWPGDSFATPKVGRPSLLFLAFLNAVPEGHLLPVVDGIALTMHRAALKTRLGSNEVLTKHCVNRLDIILPPPAVIG